MISEILEKPPLKTQSPARICHILSGQKVWGVENYVFNLINALDKNEFQSEVICVDDGLIAQKFRGANIPVTILPMSGYLDVGAIQNLRRLMREKKIDLLHTHLGLDSMLGTLSALGTAIPVVMSVHFDHPAFVNQKTFVRTVWQSVQALKNKRISHFLPITKNVAKELMERETVSKDKVSVVYPGIPISEVSHLDRNSIRHEFNLKSDDVVVVAVGRLESEKNFSGLIDAFCRAQSQQSSLSLLIVGDGSERESLQQQVAGLNLTKRVEFLGYRSDVPRILAAADMFVLPSLKEPFGMSAVEAMLAGLAVIGTEGPGLSTIVEDGVTGILVRPNDPNSMASALLKMASNSELRKLMGSNGFERSQRLFLDSHMAAKISAIYKKHLIKH